MTYSLSPDAATQAVIWGGLLIGLALGAVAQVSRFCTMSALSDWFVYRGTPKLMMWLLAVAVAATGTVILIEMGGFDATRTVAWSDRFLWLSYLVGGTVFGLGMVLASGCPQRSLVKAATGNMKAWVTLLVTAIGGEMTLRGVLAEPRARWLDTGALQLSHPQDLGSVLTPWLGASPSLWRWVILAILLVTAATLLWRNRATMETRHWIGGALVGLFVPLCWVLTGHFGFIPEHPETLEAVWMGTFSHRPEALTFTAPVAHSLDLLTLWSDRNNTVSFGVMVTLGVLLGSAASALMRKEFRLESFRGPQDLGNHMAGGLLMGFGGVTAMGCSIGQGVTGLSLLSAGSCIAVAGIVFGAWAGLRVQAWRVKQGST